MNIVEDTYEKLEVLIEAGKDDEARDFLASRMQELPEQLQADIFGIFLADAIHQEAQQEDVIEKMQKEGVAAMKILVALKESLEKDTAK